MFPIKQSTAITIPVFAHDADGDAVTGLVDAGFTKRHSKGGGAFAAMTVTLTEMENGWYSLPVGTGHSNTLGILTITLTHSSIKQINIQLRVHARILDNLAFPTDSGRSIDVNGTGEVGIDFDNTSGTLAKGSDITGFNDPTVAEIQAEMEENGASVLDTIRDMLEDGTYGLSAIETLVDELETRLSAARAGYLDELAAANLPADIDTLLTRVPAAVALASVCTELRLAELDPANLPADIAAIPTAAENNDEVVDALNIDTYAEPVQGAPAATASIAAKIGDLHKMAINKIITNATLIELYNAAGNTVDAKSTIADDGTDFTRGKFVSGP